MNLKSWKIIGALLVLPSVVGADWARSQWTIRPFVQAQGGIEDRGSSIPQDHVTAARLRRFDLIWQSRNKHNVTTQIVPFLHDPFQPLRERAVRCLGQLETPQGQAPLRALLSRMQKGDAQFKPDGVSVLALQLALGRINSRNARGQAKIVKAVEEVGLSWRDLVRLPSQINALPPAERSETKGDEVMRSVVDVLCLMADRGEDTSLLAKELRLRPAQQVQVQAAGLPTDQEVNLILDSFRKFKVSIDSDQLVSRLLDLKPRSSDLIVARMQDIRKHPQRYRQTSVESLGLLFRTAARMDDLRVLPLLKQFEKEPKPWPDLRAESQVAQQIIESRRLLL